MRMDATALRELQAPLKAKYRDEPGCRAGHAEGRGRSRRRRDRLQGRDRAGAGRGRAASGDRRQRAGGLLRRHAAGGAGRLRRRHPEGGGDGARIPPAAAARCAPRAISISAARSGSSAPRRSAFATIRLAFDLDTDEPQERHRHAAEADRALLRRAADPAQPAADRGDDSRRSARNRHCVKTAPYLRQKIAGSRRKLNSRSPVNLCIL